MPYDNGAKGKNAMPKPDEKPEVTDPVVLAAMIEDPDETDEEKKMREEMLGTTDTVPGKGTPSSDDDDEENDEDEPDEKDKKPKSDDEDTDEEETEDEDGSDSEDEPEKKAKPTKKPVEAEDDEEEDDEDEEPKKTRKQRRQDRNEDFVTSIRKDNAKSPRRVNVPQYNPLDYDKEPTDDEGNPREYKTDELLKDREMVSAVSFAKGAQEAREAAEQDAFWRDLSMEAKVLAYDPKLSFLSETTPDGKRNENFDPDKTEEINGLFLQLCGFKQYVRTDNNGNPLVDRNTGQPIVVNTVARTDLSYEKFARQYVNRMEKWASEEADDREEETRSNTIKQRKNQGIRPGGGKRKSLGALQPGDISRMSDEELEKNEAAIDAQIDAMLGIS